MKGVVCAEAPTALAPDDFQPRRLRVGSRSLAPGNAEAECLARCSPEVLGEPFDWAQRVDPLSSSQRGTRFESMPSVHSAVGGLTFGLPRAPGMPAYATLRLLGGAR
jgi:hypothetical protein